MMKSPLADFSMAQVGQLVVCVLFLANTQLTYSSKVEDSSQYGLVDEDTVSFEELPRASRNLDKSFKQFASVHSKFKRETVKGPDGTLVTINCITARNEEGLCQPFRECFPLFKLRDLDTSPGHSEGYNNPSFELEIMYKNASGECDTKQLDKIRKVLGIERDIKNLEYICCPNEPTLNPLKKPSRPPSSGVEFLSDRCSKTVEPYNSAEIDADNYTTTATFTDHEEVTSSSRSEIMSEDVQRVVNGRVVPRGAFPWTVALMNNGRQFCGGSLISNNHVLTAAHCIYSMNRYDVSRLRIRIGDHNIYSNRDGPHEVRTASNIYYHRGFSMRTLFDDVAVIRLSKPVSFGKNIQSVCLHNGLNPYDRGNTYADVAGWGMVSDRGQPSSTLRAVTVRVWSQKECLRVYRNKSPAGITQGMVCASGRGGRDSCKGDSGGPLTIYSNSLTPTQIGVVSWGIGCGYYPGVYARVDKYLAWINKNRR